MSGILEEIRDLLIEIRDNTRGGGSGAASDPAPKDKPKSAPKDKPKSAKVDHAKLTELVQPLVQVEDTKVKVKEVLTKFGLKRLGDAKEEQYEALFDAFSAIGNDEGGDEDEGLL